MISATKWLIPRLRTEEKQHLKALNSQQLQEEGLTYPQGAGGAKLFNTTVKWKRLHFVQTMLLLMVPLMMLLEISYSTLFGTYTLYFSVVYALTMLLSEDLFTRVMREKLLAVPFPGLIDVIFMLATIGAADLNAFIGSFAIDLLLMIAQRVSLEPVMNWVEDNTGFIVRVMKRNGLVWRVVLFITDAINWANGRKSGQEKGLLMFRKPDVPASRKIRKSPDLEKQLDPLAGVASRAIAACMGPFLVFMMWLFSDETRFPAQYGIRKGDLIYYLLFCGVIIPFQIGVDIIINHVYDFGMGFKLHDYMFASMWRWKSRSTRWLLDDRKFDGSLAETYQSLHQTCLSPQFYVLVAYAMWGGALILFGLTCLCRGGLPFFVDPVFGILVGIMFLLNRLLDATRRWLNFSVFWRVRESAASRALTQTVQLRLKQAQAEEHVEEFRRAFFSKHKDWILGHIDEVFDSRSLERQRRLLTSVFEELMGLTGRHEYRAPEDLEKEWAEQRKNAAKGTVIVPSLELEEAADSEILKKLRGLKRGVQEKPEDGKRRLDLLQLPPGTKRLTWAIATAWLRIAKKTQSSAAPPVRQGSARRPYTVETSEEEDDVFPEWSAVDISRTSRTMLLTWARAAQRNLNISP